MRHMILALSAILATTLPAIAHGRGHGHHHGWSKHRPVAVVPVVVADRRPVVLVAPQPVVVVPAHHPAVTRPQATLTVRFPL